MPTVRGFHVMGSLMYVVYGTQFKSISTGGTVTSIGTLAAGRNGPVYMAHNSNSELMVVDGVDGYLLESDGSTFAAITNDIFPGAATVTAQDDYFIINAPDTHRLYISGVNDGTAWDALDYFSAIGAPDNIISVFSDHREVWVMGDTSGEVLLNSGNADFPFERVPGVFIEVGSGAAASMAKVDNSLMWLGSDLMVRRAMGYTPKVVSVPQISYEIENYTNPSGAIAFSYVMDGHWIYQLTFPAPDNVTWCYDATTDLWFQKKSYIYEGLQWQGRHRANCYAFFNNKHYVGDYDNGKVYEMSNTVFTDNSQPIRRVRATPMITDPNNRNMIPFRKLEVEFESGVGLSGPTGSGADPQAMLQWSDDGGHNWSHEYWTSIGKAGKTKTRAIWRRLGRSRDRVWRVVVTDPVRVVMIGSYLN